MLSAYDIGQKQQCLPDYYRNRLTPKILISSLLVLLLIIPSILPPSAVATTALSSENIELELKATIKDFREKKRTIEKERLHYQQVVASRLLEPVLRTGWQVLRTCFLGPGASHLLLHGWDELRFFRFCQWERFPRSFVSKLNLVMYRYSWL